MLGPAFCRSSEVRISGMASGDKLPLPTSSRVPTMMRTILYKNPSPETATWPGLLVKYYIACNLLQSKVNIQKKMSGD